MTTRRAAAAAGTLPMGAGVGEGRASFSLFEDKVEKRFQVSKACTHCAAAHLSCEDEKPCRRCVKRGLTCEDRARKRRYIRSRPVVECTTFLASLPSNSAPLPFQVFIILFSLILSKYREIRSRLRTTSWLYRGTCLFEPSPVPFWTRAYLASLEPSLAIFALLTCLYF